MEVGCLERQGNNLHGYVPLLRFLRTVQTLKEGGVVAGDGYPGLESAPRMRRSRCVALSSNCSVFAEVL